MDIKQALMVSPVKQALRDDGNGLIVIVTRVRSGAYAVCVILGMSVFCSETVHNEKAVAQMLWDRLRMSGASFEPVQTSYTASPFRTSILAKLACLWRRQRKQAGRSGAGGPLWRRRAPCWPPEQVLQWLYFLVEHLLRERHLVFRIQDLHPDWLKEPYQPLYRWYVSLVVSLACGLPLGLICWLLVGQAVMLPLGLLYGLLLGLLCGRRQRIQPAEENWSWQYALVGLLFSWLFLPFGLLPIGLSFGVFCGLLGGLWLPSRDSGLDRDMSRIMPLSSNEGRRSGSNGLLVWLICGVSGVLLWLVWGGRVSAISNALMIGLAVGLPIGLRAGLVSFVQHVVLRFLLWRTNGLPFRLVVFLDQAASLGLLRKVGGSYRFSYRLLLSYFDSQEKPLPASIVGLHDPFTVASFPASPAGGKSAIIIYDGRLGVTAERIMMHWGSNTWQGITDTAMTRQRDGTWQATIVVPEDATVLNMAFYDQRGTWDNCSASDYHLKVSRRLRSTRPDTSMVHLDSPVT